uniref:Uncharacterized protein n=1 Tax=Candidatus Kentrum sp. TC TaxID=2126339 RepID=A0A450YJQ1_9GAMM|nr:MAG: hypothetical protein BECKTC1821E_GA0114239_10149 [Candidatus Kentron sp. TC]
MAKPERYPPRLQAQEELETPWEFQRDKRTAFERAFRYPGKIRKGAGVVIHAGFNAYDNKRSMDWPARIRRSSWMHRKNKVSNFQGNFRNGHGSRAWISLPCGPLSHRARYPLSAPKHSPSGLPPNNEQFPSTHRSPHLGHDGRNLFGNPIRGLGEFLDPGDQYTADHHRIGDLSDTRRRFAILDAKADTDGKGS